MGVVHMLVSPDGGRGRARAAAAVVEAVVNEAGHESERITGRTPEAAADAARAAVADGAERLIAVGGDGTVHIALQAVAGTGAALGIVPTGTGNDFARCAGLSDVPVEQASARALGPVQGVDAIAVDASGSERIWTATSVTGGFSVDVNNRAEVLRFPRGRSRYTVATLLTAPRLRHRQLTFTVDGERSEFTSALWAVANTSEFGGGMVICPGADPGDGLLDLTVVADVSRVTLLRMLPTVFKGAHVRHEKVHVFKGTRMTVDVCGGGSSVEVCGGGSSIEVCGGGSSIEVCGGGSSAYEIQGDGERIGFLPVTLTAVRSAVLLAADPPGC